MLKHLKCKLLRYSARENHEISVAQKWIPPVNINETETAYLIEAEILGANESDVQVTIRNGMLTILGECKQKMSRGDTKFQRVISYDSFEHSFRIPRDVDETTLETEFRSGLMCVTLTKNVKVKSARFNVPL